jgi:hypothetical protein
MVIIPDIKVRLTEREDSIGIQNSTGEGTAQRFKILPAEPLCQPLT